MLRKMTQLLDNRLVAATLTALLTSKQPQYRISTFPEIITEHSIAGRLRLRCRSIAGHQPVCQSLEDTLNIVEGVDKARVNVITGSILIEFEQKNLQAQQLKAAVDRLLQDDIEDLPAPKHSLSTSLPPLTADILEFILRKPYLAAGIALSAVLLLIKITDSEKGR
jgi:hypothetical protein